MWPKAALLLLLIAVAALSIASVRLDSATTDEPAHIAKGLVTLEKHWPDFYHGQLLLMSTLTGAPLVAAGYRLPAGWKSADHWGVGRQLLYHSGYDAYRILFLARLPTIVLFISLCVVIYWFVAKTTGSARWGLVAAALTGFCPNLMAHGRVATVDLALTFFAFTATALLFVLIETPSVPLAILFGLAAAAAVMTKVSGLIVLPYFGVIVLVAMRRRRFVYDLCVAAIAAFLFFEVFTLAVTVSTDSASPFRIYLANIREIQEWYGHGHSFLVQFFLGHFSYDSWPAYYPTAFLLKTTIPALILLLMAIVAARANFVVLALLGFVVLFFAVAASGHLALGLRYVLVVYPFIYSATAIALSRRPSRTMTIAVIVLVAWHIGENLAAYPGYISYFNELIGSKRNADKFLIDSNLDWGQDLRRLAIWCGDYGVQRIVVHYFGGGDPKYEIPVPTMSLGAPLNPRLPPGYFAVSRHWYRLSFFPGIYGIDYDTYLARSHARYVTTVGGSIYVFRVDDSSPRERSSSETINSTHENRHPGLRRRWQIIREGIRRSRP